MTQGVGDGNPAKVTNPAVLTLSRLEASKKEHIWNADMLPLLSSHTLKQRSIKVQQALLHPNDVGTTSSKGTVKGALHTISGFFREAVAERFRQIA